MSSKRAFTGKESLSERERESESEIVRERESEQELEGGEREGWMPAQF